jgi:HD-like signal output (HDOD) protein
MQHGLAEWQTFLIDKPLPALMRTKLDVQDLIDQSQLSITQYAGPILFDACFSASIFKHVNVQRIRAGRNSLTTLENALSHLGQTAFQNFLNNIPVFEELKLPAKNIQGYMRVMGQSCHAALQAKSWALQSNTAQFDEIYLAALLQNMTELMLWCYGGSVMPHIEKLCYIDKRPYEVAAQQVLGCGMRELGVALGSKWNFPEMATAGLASALDDFTLATSVALAAELARVVDINWYGRDALDVIKRIAKYKGRAEGEVERYLHLTAVNVSDVLLDKNY